MTSYMTCPASAIKSSVLCPLADYKSWKCLNSLYINMACKCAFVLCHMVCFIILPASMSDLASIFSIEINLFTFLTFHQLFKFMLYFSLKLWIPSFNCLFCLVLFDFIVTSIFPHSSYFLFFEILFLSKTLHPVIQSVPICLQACSTFSNWESPFIALLVWIYCFSIPFLPLSLFISFCWSMSLSNA